MRRADGEMQSLLFYDPVRLLQDLEAESKEGRPFVAFPGLIVLPRITRQSILDAIAKLIQEGYFPIRGGASDHEIVHTSVQVASIAQA